VLWDPLYRVDAKARQGQLIAFRNFVIQVTNNGTVVFSDLPINLQRDQMFYVTNVGIRGGSNVANLLAWSLQHLDNGGKIIAFLTPPIPQTPIAPAAGSTAASMQVAYPAFTGRFNANTFYSAADPSNQLAVSVSGWLLPRGNINF